MALKIFLDGSGQSEDASNQFLTLASIMASDDSWSTFEAAWSAALNRHGVPYSHMKELLRGEGPFHDWDPSASRQYLATESYRLARSNLPVPAGGNRPVESDLFDGLP